MSGVQVITPEMAGAVHADAVREHVLVGWVVSPGEDEYHNKLLARMVTGSPTV